MATEYILSYTAEEIEEKLGSIEQMNSNINAMGNDIDELSNDVDSISNDVGSMRADIINAIYPVGAIYISVSSTSPATLFGGTWEQIKDRFLLSAGSSYTAGTTGGEATHTLTIDEMPSHDHKTYVYNSRAYGLYVSSSDGSNPLGYSSSTCSAVGGGEAHNNMPPYLTVYMWKRTA